MGQIFSKCLGPREKEKESRLVAPTTATTTPPATVPTNERTISTNETAASQSPNEPTVASNRTVTPNETAALPIEPNISSPPSESIAPPNETTVLSNGTTISPAKELTFWDKAIETLPEEYKMPDEWRTPTTNGDNLVDLVKQEQQECEGKLWKIEINGKELVVRELFEKTISWVQRFVVVGDTAVQYDPGNAALPWAGFRFLLQIALNEKETYGAMLAGLERATWLTAYCSAQESLYKEYFATNPKYSDINASFVDNLVHLYAAVLKFLVQAHKYFATNTAVRMLKSIVEPSSWVRELTQAIDSRKANMEDYANLVHKKNVSQSLKDVLETLQPFSEYMSEESARRKEAERAEFMKWISDIDYRMDNETNYRDILENSGNWLLTDAAFREWKTSGTIFWLRGIPGSGKTKLTSTVINHLMTSEENHTVAYFYCIRDTKQPKKADPEQILRAILKQLVILLPGLSNSIKAKYEMERKAGKDHGSIRHLTLEECTNFIVELATNRPVTIAIDALDECKESKYQPSESSHTNRQDLLKHIDKMIAAKPGNVRVFVSSRNDEDIVHRLNNYPNITINASQNGPDILRFIKEGVDQLLGDKGHLWRSDERLKEDIVNALNDRADGMFRLPALQIDHLYSLETRKDVQERLHTLPETLRDTHDEIYQRILAMKGEAPSIAKKALTWLLGARRRLPSREFIVAVSVNPDQVVDNDHLLRLCRNLVVLDEVSDSFELAHLSVREYLETEKEYKDGQGDAVIAERCIEILELGVSEGASHQYASLYWFDHYSGSPQTKRLEMTNVLKRFFRNKGDNPVFQKWAKLAAISIHSLPWGDDLRRKLEDTKYQPLSVISTFGLSELLDQWLHPPPGCSYFRDSDEMVVHLAIKWGNKGVVRSLLQQDAVQTVDKYGFTSPFWAAIFERSDMLEMLKELPGSVDNKDKMGWTALHWLAFLGHTKGLKALLHIGAEVDTTDVDKWTPLHWAAFLGREAETKELVAGNVALNAEDRDGLTPLHWATLIGHEAIAKHLLTSGANNSSSLRVGPGGTDEKVGL
ncbi:hypothetical protein M408DRAFT_8505 [Serendipita vermifera MAFF 305830]|uniref:Uncharacterized protein n=1 Tax=Serendipita vermifera MAFF 305830 TaxID=933852 RepID=A0A0C2WR81_SERVB|nr:hypothetical protein M408DRAFT_8505 [Serendipita vermifera MAFF 305830]